MSNSCNTMVYSLPGSSAHGILQARILEWVAISFFRGSSQPRNQNRMSHIAGGFFTNWAMRGFPSSDILSHLSLSRGLSFLICKKRLLLHLHKVTEILWIGSDQTLCVWERERGKGRQKGQAWEGIWEKARENPAKCNSLCKYKVFPWKLTLLSELWESWRRGWI